MYFVRTSEQTAIISLYNINWLVCITETERVYCAVRTEVLTTIPVNCLRQLVAGLSARRPGYDSSSLRVIGLFVAHKVALRQSLTQNFRFPLSVSFHQSSIHIFTYMLNLSEQMSQTWEPSKKQCPSGNRGTLNRKLCTSAFFRSLRSVNLVGFWTLNTFRVTSHTLTAHTFISWKQKIIVYYKVKLINQYVIKIYEKVEVKLKEW